MKMTQSPNRAKFVEFLHIKVPKFSIYSIQILICMYFRTGEKKIGELEFSHKFTNQFLISSPLIS